MLELIQAYLKMRYKNVDVHEIKRIEPFICDNEQQWAVTVVNLWIPTGEEEIQVSLAELLVFLYNKETS